MSRGGPQPRIPRPDPIPEGMAFCTACRALHPVGEFYRNRNTPTGLSYWCRRASAELGRAWERRHYRRRRDQIALSARRRRGVKLIAIDAPVRARYWTYEEAQQRREPRRAS